MSSFTNRLQFAASPYLIQHQHNPVDWHEWSDEAFDKAKAENKPIFLSIGYATCHWCHVMAHESFEDQAVAKLLNDSFVCIKLDREERPDLDHLYMTVCQVMNGHGGWPLSVFINHEKEPFFTATYIPKNGRNGRPGMMEILPKISSIWHHDHEKITSYGLQIKKLLTDKTDEEEPNEAITNEELLKIALEKIKTAFDAEYAGFGKAPKFPSAHNLEFLTRYSELSGELDGFFMVEESLKSMRYGGIYDQIGFGIHRYSTDREWLLPHFEKMLYDQAGMLAAWASHLPYCKEELLTHVGQEIVTYLERDLQHPEAAFYSAEDADSEGEEGKFYVWDDKEIDLLLSQDDATWVKKIYSIKPDGNFNDEATGEPIKANIPHINGSLANFSIDTNQTISQTIDRLDSIRAPLLAHRAKRIRPLRDEKILTDWNAWLIRALAISYQKTEILHYLSTAKKTLSFLENHLIDDDGKLLHRFMNGSANIDAMAPDYMSLCIAYISLYEATLAPIYLVKAVKWMNIAIEKLWDNDSGGFYFAAEHQDLIARQKDYYDGASPSANSLAYHCLSKLASLTSEIRWAAYAEKLLMSGLAHIQAFPQGHLFMLKSVLENRYKNTHLILAAKEQNEEVQNWIKTLQSITNQTISTVLVTEENRVHFELIAPFVASIPTPKNEQTITAYICQNQECGLPINDLSAVVKLVNS